MMIEPPTASPSTIEMALAARRIKTRGLEKKPKKASRAAKRDSAARLFGPCRRSRCFASAEVSPAGVASSTCSSSPSGMSQKRSNDFFDFSMSSLFRGPTLVARLVPSTGCRVARRRGQFNMQQLPSPVQLLHLPPLSSLSASTLPVGPARALTNQGRKRCSGQFA